MSAPVTVTGQLQWAVQQLNGLSDSPVLDAEWLLCDVLDRNRAWLRTWPERELSRSQIERFAALIAQRRQGHPIAYLLGATGFWGLDLVCDPSTLIPRADTESLVEAVLKHYDAAARRVLDLGTGSGALALALASERPAWSVIGVDKVPQAVALASTNAERNGIGNAQFMVSDWFSALNEQRFDIIVANPPYIAEDDPHLTQGDLRFEPSSALVASENGYADLRVLIEQAPRYMNAGACLMLEHGFEQGDSVRSAMRAAAYVDVRSGRDFGGNERWTAGWLKQ